MILLPFEFLICRILSVLIIFVGAIFYLKGVKVDFVGYGYLFLCTAFFIGLGQIIRHSKRQLKYGEGVSALFTALGLFIVYSHLADLLGHSLFPIHFPRVDYTLVAVDSLFGFQWQEAAIFFSHIPYSAEIMSFIYLSSIFQILAIMFALSFSNRTHELGKFLVTGILGTLICIAVWFFFPSFGATSVYDLPDDVLARMPILVGPEYGKHLVKLSVEGIKLVSPEATNGAVGFPSFHTTMALMCVIFTRPFKKVWPVVVALNILMVPCIVIQGGHHLIDLIGGIAVFFVAYTGSIKLMRKISTPDAKLGSGSEISGISQQN